MSVWSEPKSDYVKTDEVIPEIFNELAENEKYLKELTDTKIRTDQVKDAVIVSTQAGERSAPANSEQLSVVVGKIRKWLADLRALAFLDTIGNSYITDVALSKVTGAHKVAGTGSYNDLINKPSLGKMAPKDTVESNDIVSLAGTKVTGTVNHATSSTSATYSNRVNETVITSAKLPNAYTQVGAVFEVHKNETLGLSVTSTYSHVITINPTTNSTYGYAVQLAQNTDGVYRRTATNATSWSSWIKILFPSDISSLQTQANSNTTKITNITNGTTTVGKSYNLQSTDTRSANDAPSVYMSNNSHSIKTEFKTTAIVGLSGAGTYAEILTITPWNDSSGGYPTQIAFTQAGIYYRIGSSESSWGSWQKLSTTAELSSQVSNLQTQINNMLNGTTVFSTLKANNIDLV